MGGCGLRMIFESQDTKTIRTIPIMGTIIETPVPDLLLKGIPVLNTLPSEILKELIVKVVKAYGKNCLIIEDEAAWLREKTSVGNQDNLLSAVLSVAYIIQKAAYNLAKPAVLDNSLEQLRLNREHIVVFVETWMLLAQDLVQLLRERTFLPYKVQNVKTSVHVEVASPFCYPGRAPLAQIAWELTDRNDQSTSTLVTEYSYAELVKLYETLEEIQQSLDGLST